MCLCTHNNYIQIVVTNQITGTVSHDYNESDCTESDNDFTVTADGWNVP